MEALSGKEATLLPPLRIMSFDIECAAKKIRFPDPKLDSIIQIANICIIVGEEEPYARNIFTLNTCAPIVGT